MKIMTRKIICPRCGKITTIDHDCPNKPRDTRKKEQLWSTRWIHIRDAVRARDGACVLCWLNGKFTRGKAVHHIIPREVNDSDNSIYNEDNCIYLCEDCHKLVHETKTSWKEYVDIFKGYINERKL